MKIQTLLAGVVAFSVAAAPALAQETPQTAEAPRSIDRAAMKDQFAQRMSETVTRLNLTPEQKLRAEPILRDSFQRRATMLQEARAGGKPGAAGMKALRKSMQDEQARVTGELDDFLTPVQLTELAKVQDEQQASMRAEIKARRASQ